MRMLTRTRAIGGSLVVTIPIEIVREKSLGENEIVEIELDKVKSRGFGLLKGIGKFKKEDELDSEI